MVLIARQLRAEGKDDLIKLLEKKWKFQGSEEVNDKLMEKQVALGQHMLDGHGAY